VAKIDDIRNIVLLGHGGSGKTSLTEAILHKTGTTNRLGTVEDKTTVCDYDDEEKQRGHSIHSALAHANYGGKLINIIDTPGYPDFVGAALLSIPAAEAAVIVVSASSGIEMNTRKLFDAATKAGKPRIIVINKMDASMRQPLRRRQGLRHRLPRQRPGRFPRHGRCPSPYRTHREHRRSRRRPDGKLSRRRRNRQRENR